MFVNNQQCQKNETGSKIYFVNLTLWRRNLSSLKNRKVQDSCIRYVVLEVPASHPMNGVPDNLFHCSKTKFEECYLTSNSGEIGNSSNKLTERETTT